MCQSHSFQRSVCSFLSLKSFLHVHMTLLLTCSIHPYVFPPSLPLPSLSPSSIYCTALLLAYIAGNTGLCNALIKAGAHPGIANRLNVSIFSSPVATKQLMFCILDQISREPTWLEGNFCQNCNMKFNISHRKHHW